MTGLIERICHYKVIVKDRNGFCFCILLIYLGLRFFFYYYSCIESLVFWNLQVDLMSQSFLNSSLVNPWDYPCWINKDHEWRGRERRKYSHPSNSCNICFPEWPAKMWGIYWRSVSKLWQQLRGPCSQLRQSWTTVAAEVRHKMVLLGHFSFGRRRRSDWDLVEELWWWNCSHIRATHMVCVELEGKGQVGMNLRGFPFV